MVAKLTVNAPAKVVELRVQTLVVFETTPFLESGLVTWLHDTLRLCGQDVSLVECY